MKKEMTMRAIREWAVIVLAALPVGTILYFFGWLFFQAHGSY
jgi:hypothetical protein